MHDQTIDPTAPEWASRLLPIPEVARIEGVNPATVYRRIAAGIYPGIIHINGSARLAGWECWDRVKARMDARSETEAAINAKLAERGGNLTPEAA